MRTHVIIVATLFLDSGLFAANLLIALWSGSRTVLSGAIYALADLIATALLLWGLHVSRRPADQFYPFGRGREVFFWAFISALIALTMAGFAAFATGLIQTVSPRPISHVGAGLAVVIATLVASIAGIWVTLRELRLARATVRTLIESAHQGLKTVFYQDVVMATGCVIALGGLLVVYQTQLFWVDGVTAALQGIFLVTTGVILTSETREYIVGRALSPGVRQALISLIERDSRVMRIRSLQSMVLGPDEALLTLRIHFHDGLMGDQIESVIGEITLEMKRAYPMLRHVVIEPSP